MDLWGKKIKQFRLAAGWSVQQFADRVGCSPNHVYKIESSDNLGEKSVKAIAAALNVQVPTLLGYHDMTVEEASELYGPEDTEKFLQRLDMLKVISADPDLELKGKVFDNIETTYSKIRRRQHPRFHLPDKEE